MGVICRDVVTMHSFSRVCGLNSNNWPTLHSAGDDHHGEEGRKFSSGSVEGGGSKDNTGCRVTEAG